ncbi:hypothetical protein LZ198_07155 [Myxococcus sp. K15C18031901]|uniref:hypothetical protein n=1 Tax=Myxococcus dinghuensis TaxID=2906761 RepID=UPI0020A74DBE|nr:hypothetical protein [Myxococcus dinghuensis]MCP3098652.1 hypothetical protein [Myxococcus dinghuensis]
MSVGPASGSRSNGISEQDAAARRAAEEARRAAAEAARRAAEAARQAAEAQARQAAEVARKSNTAFECMPRREQFDERLGAEAPATSLLTEDTQDGQKNCLDVAADWANRATPELRAKSEMVFLDDTRAGKEGESGHVVIRQGEKILDPTTNKSYESMDDFKKAQPHYQEAGSVSARHIKDIFDTKPGSPERAAALTKAKVSPELQKMMVADGPQKTSAEQAAQDYDKVITRRPSNSEPNSLFTELVKQKRTDPEYLAQLVKSAKEDGILEELVDPRLSKSGNPLDSSIFDANDKGEYSSKNPGAGELRNDVLTALDAAKAKGIITDQEIGALAQKSGPWKSIAHEMQPGWAGPRVAGTEIRGAQARYDEANAKANDKNMELQKLLAGMGPALTPKQQQKFISKFMNEPDNKKIFAAQAQAAKNLAETVEKHKEGILKSAATNPSGAKDLYTALKTIANSGAAKTAIDLAIAIKKNPDTRAAFEGFKDFDKEVMEPAIAGGMAQYLAENPKDPQGAIEDYSQKLADYKPFADNNLKPLFDLQGGIAKIKQGFGERGVPADERLGILKHLTEEYEGKGALGRGLLKGVLVAWSAVNGGEKALDGEYAEMAKEFTKSVQGGTELFAGATKALVNAGKLTQYTNAAKHADFAARFVPGLGVLANFSSAVVNLEKTFDGNPGNALAFCGDLMGMVGSAIEAVPALGALGAGINGAGGVINVVGEWAGNKIDGDKEKKLAAAEEKKFNDHRAKLLHEAVGDPELERVLLASDGTVAEKLTQDLKLDIEDVQELAKAYPDFMPEGNTSLLDGLQKSAEQTHMKPSELLGFLNAIGKGTPEPSLALRTVLDHFKLGDPLSMSRLKSKEDLLNALRSEVRKFDYDPNYKNRVPSERQGYENAIRFLEKH